MSQTTKELLSGAWSTVDLTETTRHRLLENERRRRAIFVVADGDGPRTLEEVAAAVAECESGADPTDETTLAEIETTLHHVHLPKMDEAGLLEYDHESNRIVH